MSFLNNPENNSVKVIVLIIIIAIAGYFVYNQMHTSSLENVGKVISTGSGSVPTGTTATPGVPGAGNPGAGTGKGGTGGVDPVCNTGTTGSVLLSAAATAGPSPTSVTTSTGGVVGGHWLNFSLTNPSNCPIKVTKMQFNLMTNFVTSWPVIQNISVVDTTTSLMFGSALHPELTPTPLSPMTFTSVPGVIIAPGTTENFSLISDSRNVPDHTTAGAPTRFRLQLVEFLGTNTLSGFVNDQQYALRTIPLLITPIIPVY